MCCFGCFGVLVNGDVNVVSVSVGFPEMWESLKFMVRLESRDRMVSCKTLFWDVEEIFLWKKLSSLRWLYVYASSLSFGWCYGDLYDRYQALWYCEVSELWFGFRVFRLQGFSGSVAKSCDFTNFIVQGLIEKEDLGWCIQILVLRESTNVCAKEWVIKTEVRAQYILFPVCCIICPLVAVIWRCALGVYVILEWAYFFISNRLWLKSSLLDPLRGTGLTSCMK